MSTLSEYALAARSQNYKLYECVACGRSGHTREGCFRVNPCPYCKRFGHPVHKCFYNPEYEGERPPYFDMNVIGKPDDLQKYHISKPF
jgi:hypothetical protein